jgi:hypothetical protein
LIFESPVPVPFPLEDSPGGPTLILPESDDPEPEDGPAVFRLDASDFELPLLFELLVPLRILSFLAFASVGEVVVVLLTPGVADVLSPRLVAPAIAIGTPRHRIIAIADTACSIFVEGCRVDVSNVSIFKISK